jgi:hypothetical protein
MRNILTVVALLVSLSGIAASLLREEMRCYLGLTSQTCTTSEKPTLPVSLPEKKQESTGLKSVKSIINPKPSNSSSDIIIAPSPNSLSSDQESESVSSENSSPSVSESDSSPVNESVDTQETQPSEDLNVPVESAKIPSSDTPENSDHNYATEGIPIPVEPYQAPQ